MNTKPYLVLEPREDGYALIKYKPSSMVPGKIYKELVALFRNEPDGTITRTLTYRGFPNLKFANIEAVKDYYEMEV